jgi:hypothetical protein
MQAVEEMRLFIFDVLQHEEDFGRCEPGRCKPGRSKPGCRVDRLKGQRLDHSVRQGGRDIALWKRHLMPHHAVCFLYRGHHL